MKRIEIQSFPGRLIIDQERQYLYFGGTAYLGVQVLAQFQELFIRNIKKYGTNYGASRCSNVRLKIYPEVEKVLSRWMKTESAICLSSGYLAGQLTAHYFQQKGHAMYYAPKTHSSLLMAGENTFPSYGDLKEALEQEVKVGRPQKPVILMETIQMAGGHYPHFEALGTLPLTDCILVADDSHGLGLVGSHGEGCIEILKALKPKDLIVVSSLGKALGIQGGAIFGSRAYLSGIRDTGWYAGASPPSPASMATLSEAFSIYDTQRSKLKNLTELFVQSLSNEHRLRCLPNYPVFEYDDPDLATYLFENHICTTEFIYAAGHNTQQHRIVINAQHLEEDIRKLAHLVNAFYQAN